MGNMGWMEIGWIGSFIFTLYYFQQIKMTLKDKGYEVTMFTGWFGDYKRFKQLMLDEKEKEIKVKYQGILNGLYLAIAGLIIIPILIMNGK